MTLIYQPNTTKDHNVTETEIQALHLCLAALDERLETIATATTRIDHRLAALTERTHEMEARFQQHHTDTIRRIIREELEALAARRTEQQNDNTKEDHS